MPLSEEQARAYMTKLLTAMTKAGGSNLLVSKDFPPSMRTQGKGAAAGGAETHRRVTRELAHAIMNESQREESTKRSGVRPTSFGLNMQLNSTRKPTRTAVALADS